MLFNIFLNAKEDSTILFEFCALSMFFFLQYTIQLNIHKALYLNHEFKYFFHLALSIF